MAPAYQGKLCLIGNICLFLSRSSIVHADEHTCSGWYNDCTGCISNEDTTGWVDTDCNYCSTSGQCSGSVPKPSCSGTWVGPGDSCSAPPHDCSQWNNDCYGCQQNEDTTGWGDTDCEYCFADGTCSGAVSKPYCASPDWIGHSDSCSNPPHDCSEWDNDCYGCLQNEDTTGWADTNCQYCHTTGTCSGAVSKPACPHSDYIDHGGSCSNPPVDCSAYSTPGNPSDSACNVCIQNEDTTGMVDTTCKYCTTTGVCSGEYPMPDCVDAIDNNGWIAHWVDEGQSCTGPPERSDADILLDTATCVANGIGGMITGMLSLVEMIGNLNDGETTSVCESIMSSLQSQGTGVIDSCDVDYLCALSPQTEVCQIVFMGVCIVNEGENFNPCTWLLDQFDINPSNACGEIERRLGIVQSDETQCEQVLNTLCSAARQASSGNCFSCVSSHQSQVDAADCAGTAAEEFCGNGGH